MPSISVLKCAFSERLPDGQRIIAFPPLLLDTSTDTSFHLSIEVYITTINFTIFTTTYEYLLRPSRMQEKLKCKQSC